MSVMRLGLQDLAALDALEANHYANKQTPGCNTPTTHQQPSATLKHGARTSSINTVMHTEALAAPHLYQHSEKLHKVSISGRSMLPSTQSGIGSAHPSYGADQQNCMQESPRLQQSSMHNFMAAHAARGQMQQPSDGTAAHNIIASYPVQQALHTAPQQARPGFAIGVQPHDHDCIDLITQPDVTTALDARSNPEDYAVQLAYQTSTCLTFAAVQIAEAAARDEEEHNAAEDSRAEDVLMECSSNLLNPGIRVHKYSIAVCSSLPVGPPCGI